MVTLRRATDVRSAGDRPIEEDVGGFRRDSVCFLVDLRGFGGGSDRLHEAVAVTELSFARLILLAISLLSLSVSGS